MLLLVSFLPKTIKVGFQLKVLGSLQVPLANQVLCCLEYCWAMVR